MSVQNADYVNSLSDPTQNPLVQTENQTILDLHAFMETLGHQTNLNGTIHGLTNLGETAGLGRIGGDNLITDVLHAPGDILNCDSAVGVAANLIVDAGNTVVAAGAFVEGIGHDLSNPHVVQDVVHGLIGPTLGDCSDSKQEHLISIEAGPKGGAPILDAGVLTTPDGSTPVNIDIGNGPNILDVHALSHSDALSFPNLGGTCADALTGFIPAAAGAVACNDPPATSPGHAAAPSHCFDAPHVQEDIGHATCLPALNGHAIV